MSMAKRIMRWVLLPACISPFFYLGILSFSTASNYPGLAPAQFTTAHWQQALDNGFAYRLGLSLLIAVLVALISTILGFVMSRTVSKSRFRRALHFLAYFPFVLSPVIFALLLNYYFIRFNLSGTSAGVIMAQCFIGIPYALIFFSSFWDGRVDQITSTGLTLGATNLQVFTRILLPVARPMLSVCFIQLFLVSWFEYGLTSMIGVGKIGTLTISVYQYINEANVYLAAVSCCILVLPPVLLLWLNRKFVAFKID